MREVEVAVGRELDALVAERVMGCKPVWLEEKGVHWCGCEHGPGRSPHGDGDGFIRPYSTDIGAAWEVLERISSPPAGCDADDESWTEVQVYRDPIGTWTCRIPNENDVRPDFWGHGDSAPEAIARAALAWAARKP